ncbi:MAG: BrnT family toxin [Gammaproteobacteria bacterium]
MRYEWDASKDRANQAKHGVSFATAALVFEDPRQLSVQDRHEGGEERWQTLGLVGGTVIILVAHTYREDEQGEAIIRIISARKATRRERQRYEQED